MTAPEGVKAAPPAGRTLIVTRPQPQADEWVQALRAQACLTVALPLIRIQATADIQALHQAHSRLREGDLLMFVSPNAAACYGQAVGTSSSASASEMEFGQINWPAGVLAACTGPGTAAMLRRIGVPAQAVTQPPPDSVQFDSEALWPLLAKLNWHGRQAFIVRGEAGRDWLGGRLAEAGAQVEYLSSYARQPPEWNTAETELVLSALAAPQSFAWLFSSSECIANLCQRFDGTNWSDALALATHPRIAQTAQSAGFGQVVLSRPELPAVLACLGQTG